jgi:hypothetical protein
MVILKQTKYGFVNRGMPKKGKFWDSALELNFPLICAGSLTIPGPSRSKRTDVSIGSGGALWMLRMVSSLKISVARAIDFNRNIY